METAGLCVSHKKSDTHTRTQVPRNVSPLISISVFILLEKEGFLLHTVTLFSLPRSYIHTLR